MTNKKPELLTTAGSLAELELVFRAGADAVLVGARCGICRAKTGEFRTGD